MKGDRITVKVCDVNYKDVGAVEPGDWPPKPGEIWGNDDAYYFAHRTGWGSTQMRLPTGGQIPPEQMLYRYPDVRLLWRRETE